MGGKLRPTVEVETTVADIVGIGAGTERIGKVVLRNGADSADIDPVIKGQFVPLDKANQHGVAELADTNILATNLSPTNTPCLFRTMVMLETAGVFSTILKSGAVNKTLKFNGGVALAASCAYMFDILVMSGDTVNFQTDTSGNVTLRCQEIVAGVQ